MTYDPYVAPFPPLANGMNVWIARSFTGDTYGFVAGTVARDYDGTLPFLFVRAVDPETHEVAEMKVHRSKVTTNKRVWKA